MLQANRKLRKGLRDSTNTNAALEKRVKVLEATVARLTSTPSASNFLQHPSRSSPPARRKRKVGPQISKDYTVQSKLCLAWSDKHEVMCKKKFIKQWARWVETGQIDRAIDTDEMRNAFIRHIENHRYLEKKRKGE